MIVVENFKKDLHRIGRLKKAYAITSVFHITISSPGYHLHSITRSGFRCFSVSTLYHKALIRSVPHAPAANTYDLVHVALCSFPGSDPPI